MAASELGLVNSQRTCAPPIAQTASGTLGGGEMCVPVSHKNWACPRTDLGALHSFSFPIVKVERVRERGFGEKSIKRKINTKEYQ